MSSASNCPQTMASDKSEQNDATFLCDCSLCTPVPWVILGGIMGIVFIVSLVFFTQLDRDYFPCNGWNNVEYEWKLDNCDAYGNLNDTTNNDTWILCNMFINVNEMHNPQYNWFETLDNINYNYSNNRSISNISACDWDFISCYENGRITEINMNSQLTLCSDINVTYIPYYLQYFHIGKAFVAFNFDLLTRNFLPNLQKVIAYYNNISGYVNFTNMPSVYHLELEYK